MNKCKYIKVKINKGAWCTKTNTKCTNCTNKEYEKTNNSNLNKLKSKSTKLSKLSKLERNRFSLFSDNQNKCYFCPSTTNLTWHETFRGRNRANSMKYGLCLRMCWVCHKKYQEDKVFNDYWHKIGQKRFMEYYHKSIEEFVDIFKKNYLP